MDFICKLGGIVIFLAIVLQRNIYNIHIIICCAKLVWHLLKEEMFMLNEIFCRLYSRCKK